MQSRLDWMERMIGWEKESVPTWKQDISEEPEENDLLAAGLIRPAPVLKVGNHGEDDATGKAFAIAARPQWAIISTNTEDEPDTPDDKVLKRLREVGATVAVTQDAGVGILITLQGGRVDAQRIDWQ